MFDDRKQAGELLGTSLKRYRNLDPVILAIPRGGVPVAYEIVKALKAPLDVVLTKKIGHPLDKEYAIGAVGIMTHILNESAREISEAYLLNEVRRVQKIVEEKEQMYHKEIPRLEIINRWIILVDDGAATGSTILVTADLLKKRSPAGVIVAVPVAPQVTVDRMKQHPSINEVVCLETPHSFKGVGQFYKNFNAVEDSEAIELLRRSRTIKLTN